MTGPLVVQQDRSVLLELGHPQADAARAALATFAELDKSPEHVHTYRITDLGLWNACAAGHDADSITGVLQAFSRFPVPPSFLDGLGSVIERYGRLVLADDPRHGLVLSAGRPEELDLLQEVVNDHEVTELLGPRLDDVMWAVPGDRRGPLKRRLVRLGWPAEDRAGYQPGTPLEVGLRPELELRPYQHHALAGWQASGNGVVVLPCGAGKTVVAIAAMADVGSHTLVLVTSQVVAEQWRRELLRFTDLDPTAIGEYSGRTKDLAPVTIATYQVMTRRRDGRHDHLERLTAPDWGLVVYDEVHLLPAPVFRLTAEIQSRRRLGLTATLVREDGRADEVFSLIGPKRFDAPWRDLELQGWIAPASCTEVRVPLDDDDRLAYARTEAELRPAFAANAAPKRDAVRRLLARHPGEQALIIGTYVEPLERLASELGVPLLTGSTPQRVRQQLFDGVRSGDIDVLVVSKVANFSIDLPEVSVAIQVSGTFGSRQEEAQRLGRIVRPKADGRAAHFYTVVARDTVEQEYAARRQRFLAEQGYAYEIVDAADL
ncbi:MAG: DEAD/DEAH box helicase [Acidimicrobiales bacterium]|nr:DEAD/DEAH box helicase [Acidimicrobiales bacterium]